MKRLILLLLLGFLPALIQAAEYDCKTDTLKFVYKLHGQTRRFQYIFHHQSDGGIVLEWGIERNLKWWKGYYRMSARAVESGDSMSFLMPEDGNDIALESNSTFALISRRALAQLKKNGWFEYDGFRYETTGEEKWEGRGKIIRVKNPEEGAEMWIADDERLPIVVKMEGNPLEIDWNSL